MENQKPQDDREQVEFYISCKDLKNMDILSKSDPQVRLYVKNASNTWKLHSATEVIQNNLNPTFQRTFLMDFIFETQQHIKFDIVDNDGNGSDDVIASVETTVGAVMGARKQTLMADLTNREKPAGQLIVRGDKAANSNSLHVSWQWSGVKLMNTDGWFGKSDPFLRFLKKKEDGSYLQVHQSEVIRNNLNPIWRSFRIADSKLCSNYSQDFKVECWDREGSGNHQFIGDFETSLDKIKSGVTEYELQNPKKKAKTGTLHVSNFNICPPITFVDYLRGGTQLNMVVAIDFTGSNGNPSSSFSLHNRSMDPPNQYHQAISSVCPIVLNYDSDQLVPLYGFGGIQRNISRSTSHCFPLTGSESNDEVKGVEGILSCYHQSLDNVELSGPTNFATVIKKVREKCKEIKKAGQNQYVVLLILTDGEISDMSETIQEVLKASELPLSIIIVGVGDANFGNMERLDGDDGGLASKDKKEKRDLVQFVPFRDFNGNPELLAKSVLAEIPNQLIGYMDMMGKKP